VAVLLFTVGLKLDLHLRRRLGAVASCILLDESRKPMLKLLQSRHQMPV